MASNRAILSFLILALISVAAIAEQDEYATPRSTLKIFAGRGLKSSLRSLAIPLGNGWIGRRLLTKKKDDDDDDDKKKKKKKNNKKRRRRRRKNKKKKKKKGKHHYGGGGKHGGWGWGHWG